MMKWLQDKLPEIFGVNKIRPVVPTIKSFAVICHYPGRPPVARVSLSDGSHYELPLTAGMVMSLSRQIGGATEYFLAKGGEIVFPPPPPRPKK